MRRDTTLPKADTIESVLIKGDLSQLTPEQRNEYYMRVCQSVGLNHLTRPFDYLTLNGKLQLYARKDATDQLRKINGISIEIVSQDRIGDLLSIHVRAKDQSGRSDEDLGVVSLPQKLIGDAAANQILKAVTKAKRRVTLSISGLGFLDETEVSDIPASAKGVVEPVKEQTPPATQQIEHDPQTGEVKDAEPYQLTIPLTGDDQVKDWVAYGSAFLNHIKNAKDKREIDKWLELNNKTLDQMEKEAPKVYKRLMAAAGIKE